MLRACRRVLKGGASLAFFVIHVADALPGPDRRRAVRTGPRAVGAGEPYPVLLERAGFIETWAVDQTDPFLRFARRLLVVSAELEEGLRAVQGDEAFERYQRERRDMVSAIEDGLLHRSLFGGTAPRRSGTPR